jgi:zinc protease
MIMYSNQRAKTLAVAMFSVALTFLAGCTSSADLESSNDVFTSTTATDGQVGGVVGDTATDIPPGVPPIIDDTPLPVDSEIRIGTLENGLTYYLRRNDAPGQKLSVRLVVNAGSLQQVEPTDQIAHFTEHMLFNGTAKYPGNSLDAELGSLGAQIGPDLNAYTSFDETVYQLEVSLEGANAETAFTVLGEWSGNATMDPTEVANERGVVREEFRLARERAGAAVQQRFEEVYFDRTPYEDRSPIGTEEQIISTTEADTRAFYDRWYRPDNMAVVAVGDLSLDDLEEFVSDTFADLERRGDEHPPREEPVIDMGTSRVVDVLADPSVDGTFISVDYRTPSRNPGTYGGEQLNQWEFLISTMITNRVNEAITSGTSSLVRGGGGPFSQTRRMSFIGFNLDGADLAQGTGEFLSLMKTLERDGFTESELQRAREQEIAALDQELAQLGTRQDSQWADLYSQHFLGGADASKASDRRDRVAALVKTTTTQDLSGYFRWLMEMAQPLVIVVGPDASDLPSVEELTAVVDAAVATADENREVVAIDELMAPPDPVDISSERSLEAAGGQEWTFENGSKVIFAESQIAEGTVNLFGLSKGGWSLLPGSDQPLLEPAVSMVATSGVGDLSKVAMDRFLADKVVGVMPFVYETGEGIQAEASPDDLEIAFQLVHLFLTQPRVDESAFNRVIVQKTEELRAVQNQPQVAANRALGEAINDDEPDRNPLLDRAELDTLTPEKSLALYRSRMAGVDDLVLTVVGDANESDVEDLARRYIGTIPSRPADTFIDLLDPRDPGVITVQEMAGPAGGAGILTMLFNSPAEFDDSDRIHAEILQAIMEERLFTRIREQLGASYNGGFASVGFIDEPDNESQLYINVAGDPDRLEEIRDTLLSELTELDTSGPSTDEFERAVAKIVDNYNFISNGDIIDQLIEESTQDGPVLTNQAGFNIAVDTRRSDIARLAGRVIDTGSWIEVFVTPAE